MDSEEIDVRLSLFSGRSRTGVFFRSSNRRTRGAGGPAPGALPAAGNRVEGSGAARREALSIQERHCTLRPPALDLTARKANARARPAGPAPEARGTRQGFLVKMDRRDAGRGFSRGQGEKT